MRKIKLKFQRTQRVIPQGVIVQILRALFNTVYRRLYRSKIGEKITGTRDKRAKLGNNNRSRWHGTRDWPVFITFPGAPVPPRTLVWKGGAISIERPPGSEEVVVLD